MKLVEYVGMLIVAYLVAHLAVKDKTNGRYK